jgi:hypothetical protein
MSARSIKPNLTTYLVYLFSLGISLLAVGGYNGELRTCNSWSLTLAMTHFNFFFVKKFSGWMPGLTKDKAMEAKQQGCCVCQQNLVRDHSRSIAQIKLRKLCNQLIYKPYRITCNNFSMPGFKVLTPKAADLVRSATWKPVARPFRRVKRFLYTIEDIGYGSSWNFPFLCQLTLFALDGKDTLSPTSFYFTFYFLMHFFNRRKLNSFGHVMYQSGTSFS